jgi:ferric iron reductase protein FhuF
MTEVTLINTSKQDLLQAVEGVLEFRFTEMLKELKSQREKPSEDILTRKALKDLLDISYPTMAEWEKQGILRRRTMGKRVYYLKSEILEGLEKSRLLNEKTQRAATPTSIPT